MTDKYYPSFEDCRAAADGIASRVARSTATATDFVFGIPQGGLFAAMVVAESLGLGLVDAPVPGRTLIVDDLIDTGTTAARFVEQGYRVEAMFRKPHSPAISAGAIEVDGWIVFPWERDQGEPTDAVVRLLQFIGEDPSRDGLLDTPRRVVKALSEMTEGYGQDPAAILGTTFDVAHDDMIVVRDVAFNSMCEHHMLPFTGTATIAYIPRPGGRIVGLSKLPRLLDCFAHRLQVQERLTDQVASAIKEHLNPLGVGVILTASHSCMALRGIRKHGQMITSSMHGVLLEKPEARAELMALHRG